MRMAGDDGNRAAGQLEPVGELLQDRLHEGTAHLAVVERHKYKPLSRPILQRQGLDQQRMIKLVGRALPPRVTGQPDGQFRGDVAHGEPHVGS